MAKRGKCRKEPPKKESPKQVSQLADSERRFRLLVEGVSDYAIYMLDPEGIITNWNVGAERIKGYSAGDIIGQHFSIFYTPEDRAAGLPFDSLERARREKRFEAEGWRVRKDGTRFLASVVIDAIYADGGLIGFAKITRDVTERHAADVALRSSEQQLRLLIGGVTDYALYMLDLAGNVTTWNAGGERIKGYTQQEIIGQHFSRFYMDSDRTAGRPARALRIARETGRYEEEGWRVRKDGTFFWASVVIDPIKDGDGRLVGFAKITRDITERRKAQEKLEKIQKQFSEIQKMDALGQLTGGVAHDFNNLLMIIGGNIQLLKKLAENDPKGQRAAQAIELATQRGGNLTRQLLTFARKQRLNPETVNIGERLELICEILNSGLGSVQLLIEPGLKTWPVFVDAQEFEIGLVNLAVNARDAMSDVGILKISAENVDLQELATVAGGEFVAIRVEDSGVGIPKDIIEKVFDPFFTTKPVGKGTGLGLSQVHGFAHQAGGTVEVASTLEKGTVISIYLPRAREEQMQASEWQAAEWQERPGTILLVEDNPEVANASTTLLEQLGYSVRWASSADAALREIEKNGIDILFSDIVMPGHMDGISFARAVRLKHPHLPILLATGYAKAGYDVGSDFPILRKPYALHELSQALAKLNAVP